MALLLLLLLVCVTHVRAAAAARPFAGISERGVEFLVLATGARPFAARFRRKRALDSTSPSCSTSPRSPRPYCRPERGPAPPADQCDPAPRPGRGGVLSLWGGPFFTAFCSTDCPRSASYEVIAVFPSCTTQQPHPGPQPAYNAAASSYESCWPRGTGQRGCARPAPRGQAPGVLRHSKRQPASTGGRSSSPAGLRTKRLQADDLNQSAAHGE